ncbi:MAG: hypothetical protein AAF442_01735 [Pseudomonadota bacterium]
MAILAQAGTPRGFDSVYICTCDNQRLIPSLTPNGVAILVIPAKTGIHLTPITTLLMVAPSPGFLPTQE